MRELMQEIHLKPTEAEYKVAVIVAADRMNPQAANAFLKTLEEPPANSILVLVSTESQRLLETILSRCLRLKFGGDGPRPLAPAQFAWLNSFSQLAADEQKSLLSRYRLTDLVLKKLSELKESIEKDLTARSPLQRYPDAEKETVERWEDELKAAIEAEYRRQRAELVVALEWWLRDIWLQTLKPASQGPETASASANDASRELLAFPQITGTSIVAKRISSTGAMENLVTIEQLHRRLYTNVQEALALEVGLLKLNLA
jgi:DNA polymerase-3 subunit delta'